MFRREVRTILCPSCGRLTRADAAECLICGRRRPGMWGLTTLLHRVFPSGSVTQVITVVCVALYVASLVFDAVAAFRPRGGFNIFAPSSEVLWALGATGSLAWRLGRWWTFLTAIYLHGGVLHILFNVLWIRQLGPAVEELYGSARFFVIFTVAGVVGFILSSLLGHALTLGASGSIFGLFGAIVAFGQRRGGIFCGMMWREDRAFDFGPVFVRFMIPRGPKNPHPGRLVGGLADPPVLSPAQRLAGADPAPLPVRRLAYASGLGS